MKVGEGVRKYFIEVGWSCDLKFRKRINVFIDDMWRMKKYVYVILFNFGMLKLDKIMYENV